MENLLVSSVVGHITDGVTTSLESCMRLFPGRSVEVTGAVIGGCLLSAANLAGAVGMCPEDFSKLADAYLRRVLSSPSGRTPK
jgi:hypothetical protein